MAPTKVLRKFDIFDNPECTLPQFVLSFFGVEIIFLRVLSIYFKKEFL